MVCFNAHDSRYLFPAGSTQLAASPYTGDSFLIVSEQHQQPIAEELLFCV
jgi:hypothetical protein